mgnify:FL=1|jgi:hypothetical protein
MLKPKPKHKKAFIIGSLVTFYAILVLVLIFVIFGMLFRLGIAGRTAEISSASAGTGVNKMFINYLRSDFTMEDGTVITIAELYSRYSSDVGIIKAEKDIYKSFTKAEISKISQKMYSSKADHFETGRIDHEIGSQRGFYLPLHDYKQGFINTQPIIADDILRNKIK